MVTAFLDAPPILTPPLDLKQLVPRDYRSIEDFYRRRHLDLPNRDDFDLAIEASAIVQRLPSTRDAGDREWLRERWYRLRDKTVARRRRPNAPPPPQPNGPHDPGVSGPSPAPGLVVGGIALPQREGRRRDR